MKKHFVFPLVLYCKDPLMIPFISPSIAEIREAYEDHITNVEPEYKTEFDNLRIKAISIEDTHEPDTRDDDPQYLVDFEVSVYYEL